ncbi:MAG TPA: VWA domain-containing protein [Candidatus Udaeobacter sp.]|nr:VWA domain-containing protein [Candidatus Udaeobacter sp.]
MRGLLGSLLIGLLLVPANIGQQGQPPPLNPRSAPQPPPAAQQSNPAQRRIHVEVNLVLIDVRVTDRNGKPIRELKPEQFTVFEDDKSQKVSTFQYFDVATIETAGTTEPKRIVVPLAGVAPAESVQQEIQNRRLIVLFYDMTSMHPDALLRAVKSGEQFLRAQMSPVDLVSVVAFGNQLRVLANFTNNRDALMRAIRGITPGKESWLTDYADAAPAPGDEVVAEDTGAAFTADETEFNVFNSDRKLSAVESLSKLLRQIPGKKSVIHFTSGITQTGEENRSQLDAAVDAANRSNVTLYTVDARGLYATVPGDDASMGAAIGRAMFTGDAVFRQAEMRYASRDTLATLATDTGGRAFFDLGDFSEVFRRVQEEGTGYYLLGYYSTDSKHDGRWRRVRVKVSVPGAHVQYRKGYYAASDYGTATAEDRQQQLDQAMRAEAPRVEFPVALETTYFRLNEREFFVPVAAKVDSTALEWAEKGSKHEARFDFAAEVRDEQSHRIVSVLQDSIKISLGAERFQQVQRRALLYQGGVILPPGSFRVKFLAREDETGRIGTFEEDLKLPALQPARLELSSVLLSSQLEPRKDNSEVKRSALGPDARLKVTPLDVQGGRIVPSVTRVFTTQQKLTVFFQAYWQADLDGSKLRAGLVFYRNGEWSSETPVSPPSQVDTKAHIASFRIELPLDKFQVGEYAVQVITVNQTGEQAGFARNYFALRPPLPERVGTSGESSKQ